jgi:hypothetical protein
LPSPPRAPRAPPAAHRAARTPPALRARRGATRTHAFPSLLPPHAHVQTATRQLWRTRAKTTAMSAAAADTEPLSARCGFDALPDSLLVSLLLLLPLDVRLRCCVLSKRWAALLRTPPPLAHISFSGLLLRAAALPDGAALERLCRLAGGALRSLDVSDEGRCARITAHALAAALRHAPRLQALRAWAPGSDAFLLFKESEARAVAASCPLLRDASLALHAPLASAASALAAAPAAVAHARLTLGGAVPSPPDALRDALRGAVRLQALSLNQNALRCGGLTSLAAALAEAPALAELSLNQNSLADAGVIALAAALSGGPPPRGGGGAGGGGGGADAPLAPHAFFAAPLSPFSSPLRVLTLRHNTIGDAGASALAPLCARFLEALDLQDNRVGADGCAALAAALRTHACTLRHLDLRRNRGGAAGAASLAGALITNASLTSLSLAHNEIGDDGAASLTACFAHNAALKKLSVVGNGISKEADAALEGARRARKRAAAAAAAAEVVGTPPQDGGSGGGGGTHS